MLVSTTDFQANMDKYLALIAHEDVFITLNGKPITDGADENECGRLPARTFERGSCRSRYRVYTKGASAAS